MPNYLVSYTFNALRDGGAGWSENFYLTQPTTLDGALTRASAANYLTARRAMLHPYFRMYSIRVSDVAEKGDGLVRPLTECEGIGLYPAPSSPLFEVPADTSEEPYDSVLLRMQSSAGVRRRMFKLGGIPINIIS